MPFGKYKGELLEHVPDDYLRWVLDNLTDLGFGLRRAIEVRLGIRPDPTKATSTGVPDILPRIRSDIDTCYRRMCRRFHPDHGGTNDQQIVVNECFDAIRKAIREVTR
jgi:hypothetical protein